MVSEVPAINWFMLGVGATIATALSCWAVCKVFDFVGQVRYLETNRAVVRTELRELWSRVRGLEFEAETKCHSMITSARDAETEQCKCGKLTIETPKCAAKDVGHP